MSCPQASLIIILFNPIESKEFSESALVLASKSGLILAIDDSVWQLALDVRDLEPDDSLVFYFGGAIYTMDTVCSQSFFIICRFILSSFVSSQAFFMNVDH